MLYDLVLRLEAGTADCSNVQGNPEVTRLAFDPTDTDLIDGYLAAGLCPAGEVDFVSDRYTNLDTRKLDGYDIGIYYTFETGFGMFDLRYNGSFYETFEQTASGTRGQGSRSDHRLSARRPWRPARYRRQPGKPPLGDGGLAER